MLPPSGKYLTIPDHLLEPDVCLPGHFLARTRPCDGERALYRAVLDSALDDMTKYRYGQDARSRYYVQEVRRWMSGEWHVDRGFTFDECCAALGLAPDAVRRAVLG